MIRKAIVLVGPPIRGASIKRRSSLPMIGGLTLPERIVYQLAQQGVDHALLVGLDTEETIYSRTPGPDIRIEPLKEVSLRQAFDRVAEEPVLVIRADRIYHVGLLGQAIGGAPRNAAVAAITGTHPESGQTTPVGIAAVDPGRAAELLDELEAEADRRRDAALSLLEDLVEAARARGLLREDGMNRGGFWYPVESKDQMRPAVNVLFKSLGKPVDGWISRHFNRPVSQAVSKLICNTRWTPNQISIPVFLVGLAAAAVWFTDNRIWIAVGGVLFHLASVLDGVDGEIARVKFQHTKMGALMDSILDHIVLLAYIWAAGHYIYYTQGGSAVYLIFGYITVAFGVIGTALVNYDQIKKTRSGKPMDLSWEFEKPEHKKKVLSRVINAIRIFVSRDFDAVALGTCAIVGFYEGIPICGIAVSTIYFTVVVGHRLVLLFRKPASTDA